MEFTVKLRPRNRSDSHINSSTLFGAIVSTYRSMYGSDECANLLQMFGMKKIALSSAFPFIDEGKTVYCLPKPYDIDSLDIPEGIIPYEYQKKIRKSRYVSAEIFNKFMAEGNYEGLFKDIQEFVNFFKINGPKQGEEQHAFINRLSSSTMGQLYFKTYHSFKRGGLFFLVKMLEESNAEKVIAAIRLMGEKGIGRDTSTGFGCYDVSIERGLPVEGASSGDRMCLLSIYSPSEDEVKQLDIECSAYRLMVRQGLMPNGFLRKRQLFFTEGSCFGKFLDMPGKIIDCGSSGRPSFENGLGFAVRARGLS